MPALQKYSATQIGSVSADAADRRVTWTTSLPLLLSQLDLAIRKPVRHRRLRQRRNFLAEQLGELSETDTLRNRVGNVGPSEPRSKSASPAVPARKSRKGKHRAVPETDVHLKPAKTATIPEEPQAKPEAWFLDVASPTWADLRAIGKVCNSWISVY